MHLSSRISSSSPWWGIPLRARISMITRSPGCLLRQGIALSADRNYKVLGSAYPWIARRLLSDSSVELQETLRALLYKGNRFQFGRLESLLRQAVRSPPRSAVASGSRPGVQVSPGAQLLSTCLKAAEGCLHLIPFIASSNI